jgi:hypothetical protein
MEVFFGKASSVVLLETGYYDSVILTESTKSL